VSKQRSRLAGSIRNRDSVMLHHMQRARRPVVPQSVTVATTDAEAPEPKIDALAAELLRRKLQA
jgi:hypothetical protein